MHDVAPKEAIEFRKSTKPFAKRVNDLFVIDDDVSITPSIKQHVQETLNFDAKHSLLPTNWAIGSADNSEKVGSELKNGCSKTAPTNSSISRVFNACAIAAEQTASDIKASFSPRVKEEVLGAERVNHVQGPKASEPKGKLGAIGDVGLPSSNDLVVDEVGVFQNGLAEVAEMSPNSSFQLFATAGALNQALIKHCEFAESSVGSALDHDLQPVGVSVVFFLSAFPEAAAELR